MKVKNIVVGAGFAGSVLARRIAEELNEDVLLVDRRAHIGGQAYDRYNEYGVLIHQYGPHIFHTNNKGVWDWLSRFSEWFHYQHKVLSYVDGMFVPFPISAITINMLKGCSLSCDEFIAWRLSEVVRIDDPKNAEESVLSQGGRIILDKFFKNYTEKQWGRSISDIDSSVVRRIPFRNNLDQRYFVDKYQGLPKYGYNYLFSSILNHPKIHLVLNTDWDYLKSEVEYKRLFFTGEIDAFFGYMYGPLPYRSIRFQYETFFDREFFQQTGTVNYPNDYDFTRITEYKYLTGQKIDRTTIAREYPEENGEPFYIVPGKETERLLNKYKDEAIKLQNVTFVGRLAEYKYYNMDQIVEKCLGISLDQ